MPRQPKLRKKKVGASVYWFTKAGGDTYFGSVDAVPYSEAKKLFTDHVEILAENQSTTNSKGMTAGDLIVVFLEWIEKKRSRQTLKTRKLYCTRFANFEFSPGNRIADLPANKVRGKASKTGWTISKRSSGWVRRPDATPKRRSSTAGIGPDVQRVYATSMSNGAIMAYRLASELSDRIAAIAPVAGAVGIENKQPKRPVPVLHFHGTKDEFIPFLGGRGEMSITGTDFRSVDHSIQTWVKLNGCDESPRTDVLSRNGDEMIVTRKAYASGKDGSEVALVVIEGGGHTWPGRKSLAATFGTSATNVSANDLMWEFFQKHELKSKP